MPAARLSSTALAFLAAAAAAFAAGAEDVVPPLTVVVKPAGHTDAAVVMPVEFTAPLESAAFSGNTAHYTLGPNGELFACQVEPFGQVHVDLGYRWGRVRMLAPLVEQTYHVLSTRNASRPEVPLVATLLGPDGAVLETNIVRLTFDHALFTVARSVQVAGKPAVPEYRRGLMNRQQGLALVVTDRLRQADFPLAPKVAEGGFRLLQSGPVEASVACEGVFAAPGGVSAVPFEASVSLFANHILSVNVRVPAGAFDEETYELKRLTITLPLLLRRAAGVAFGGTYEHVAGVKRWQGRAHLAVREDGSYEFTDANGSVVSGKGPVTWAHYGNGEGGVACFWRDGAAPVEFAVVEYDHDLVSLSVTPVKQEDGSHEAGASFLFPVRGADPALLGSCAAALAHPAAAAADQAYIEAVTRAR